MQTRGLLIRKYFVKLNCEVSSCKQGPLLALPQTPGEKSIQSPLLSRILWEKKKKYFQSLDGPSNGFSSVTRVHSIFPLTFVGMVFVSCPLVFQGN